MRLLFTIILSVLSLFLLSGCSPKANYDLFGAQQDIAAKKITHKVYEYHIQPHDRVKILIYKNPEETELLDSYASLSTAINKDGILVDAHGYVLLPLIGRIKLAGKTQHVASELIAQRYSKYLRNPSVYLEVMDKRAFILGEVQKKGILRLNRETMGLIEAIAIAGGMTDSAVRTNILIISDNRYGKKKIRSVDLTKFDSLNSIDMLIKPNDIIYVPSDKWRKIKANMNDILPIISTANTAIGYLD